MKKFHPKGVNIVSNTISLTAGELASGWNQIYPSLLNTYEKLKKLDLQDKIDH